MGRYSVFRDDDVNCFTDLRTLQETHELIVSHGHVHTVAVEVDNIWRAKSIWFFLMTQKNLNVVLHGWDHSDYSVMPYDEIRGHLYDAMGDWKEHSKAYGDPHPLTVWCPPWNLVSEDMRRNAENFGLTIDTRWKGDSDVYGFHSWECADPARKAKLIKALKS